VVHLVVREAAHQGDEVFFAHFTWAFQRGKLENPNTIDPIGRERAAIIPSRLLGERVIGRRTVSMTAVRENTTPLATSPSHHRHNSDPILFPIVKAR